MTAHKDWFTALTEALDKTKNEGRIAGGQRYRILTELNAQQCSLPTGNIRQVLCGPLCPHARPPGIPCTFNPTHPQRPSSRHYH